jgi:hypothetical protein
MGVLGFLGSERRQGLAVGARTSKGMEFGKLSFSAKRGRDDGTVDYLGAAGAERGVCNG